MVYYLRHNALYNCMYSIDSIIRTVSIKRTVGKNFHVTLLNVPYDLKVVLGRAKRTVSIKRTV